MKKLPYGFRPVAGLFLLPQFQYGHYITTATDLHNFYFCVIFIANIWTTKKEHKMNFENDTRPVILVVSEKEPIHLILEIARNFVYEKDFLYDIVETPQKAVAHVKNLSEKGREVIGIIADELDIVAGLEHLPAVKVAHGEVTAFRKTAPGKQWGEATKKLLRNIVLHSLAEQGGVRASVNEDAHRDTTGLKTVELTEELQKKITSGEKTITATRLAMGVQTIELD